MVLRLHWVIRVAAGKAATSIGFRTASETGHEIKPPVSDVKCQKME